MEYITAKVEVKDKKLKEIMQRLDRAKGEIRECYEDLKELEVITLIREDKKNSPA